MGRIQRRSAALVAAFLGVICGLTLASCGNRSAAPSEETHQTSGSVSLTETTASLTTETRPEQDVEPESVPVAETDPNVLAEFVSQHNGNYSLDDRGDVAVKVLEPGQRKGAIPAELFVVPTTLALFKILGLVDVDADGDLIAQHRVDSIRGACCPVAVWENDDDPLLRSVVVVHELTHLADIGRGNLYQLLDEDLDVLAQEQVSLVAVPVEGNASRVHTLYQDELVAAGADPNLFQIGWTDPAVPEAVARVWQFAYVDGQIFMQALFDRGGYEYLNLAFERPPTSSEQVYDIDAYLAEELPLTIDPPDTPSGAKPANDKVTLGAFVLKLLAERSLSDQQAQNLATAWAGDATILYKFNNQSCVSSSIVMDSKGDAASLVDVLTQISDDVVVDYDDLETVDFTRCIPSIEPD